MFFWEDDVDESIIKNEGSLESKGNYSPHNLDINWTYFNVFNERSYSRWRFHFILASSLLMLISLHYPIFFIILFFDLSVWVGSSVSDFEWMTEDYFYDYTLYLSQRGGGDSRINIYVFVYYDRLGYVIYGFSEIGVDYCDDLFEYNNLFGLNDFINTSYVSCNNLKSISEENKIIVNNFNSILNDDKKYNYVYRNNNILDLELYNNHIMNLLNSNYNLNLKTYNYYYKYNKDRILSWTALNDFITDHWKK